MKYTSSSENSQLSTLRVAGLPPGSSVSEGRGLPPGCHRRFGGDLCPGRGEAAGRQPFYLIEGPNLHIGVAEGERERIGIDYRLTWWAGAGLVRLKPIMDTASERATKGLSETHVWNGQVRRPITEFSTKSARQLMQRMAMIDEVSWRMCLFAGLTYPSVYPATIQECKLHRRALEARLKRRYPHLGLIWKLEPQKRGAPHFHLFIFGVAFIPFEWIAQAWYEIVGSGDARHLKSGVRLQRVDNDRMARNYVNKYFAKPTPSVEGSMWDKPGRFWGFVWMRPFLGAQHQRVIPYASALAIRRLGDQLRLANARRRRGKKGRAITRARRRRSDRFSRFYLCRADQLVRSVQEPFSEGRMSYAEWDREQVRRRYV